MCALKPSSGHVTQTETGSFPTWSGVLAFRDIKVNFSPIHTVIGSQADICKNKSAWLLSDKINAFR